MAETAEVFLSMETQTDTPGDDAMYRQNRLGIRIKGTLRKRALDIWLPTEQGVTRRVDLGPVEGVPLLMVFYQGSTPAQKHLAITYEDVEVSGSGLVLNETAVMDLDRMSPVSCLGPQLNMTAEDFGNWDAFVMSCPWLAYDAAVFADYGPYRFVLLEFEEDSIDVSLEAE